MTKSEERALITQQEIDALRQENLRLIEENDKLCKSNDTLIEALKSCHNDITGQVDVLMALKKEMLSYEVQLESMTAENVTLKTRIDKIENNPIGKIAFKTYRNLRDLKTDIYNAMKKNDTKISKSQSAKIVQSLQKKFSKQSRT